MERATRERHEAFIIRERRNALGMTQEEVADESGIALQQYQRYEYGEHKIANCPMRIGLRICAVLELDPYELVFGRDNDI